jgi:putative membrane protein
MNKERLLVPVVSLLSIVILSAVYFLTYGKSALQYEGQEWRFLADLNACLNLSTAVLLISGLIAIKRGNRIKHQRLMITALFTSTLFFISYASYHYLYGDTKFLTQGLIRPIYFLILITHILASGLLVPFLLTTLFHIFTGNEQKHKIAARWTWPIWAYVSVTGVLIYIILKFFNTIV